MCVREGNDADVDRTCRNAHLPIHRAFKGTLIEILTKILFQVRDDYTQVIFF